MRVPIYLFFLERTETVVSKAKEEVIPKKKRLKRRTNYVYQKRKRGEPIIAKG